MDDFFDGFFDLLGDWFGEVGIWFVSLGTLVTIFAGYFVWWEWIR